MNSRRFIIFFSAAIGIASLLAPRARAGTTMQPVENFDVHEYNVFVLDAFQNTLNPNGTVGSTAPAFVTERRTTDNSSANNPSPVGILRFIGNCDTMIDVKIEKSAGTFLASWPKAQHRSNQILWRDLSLVSGPPSLEAVADGSWFAKLRLADSSAISSDKGASEQFLLYDIEIPYPCPLKVKAEADFSVDLTNTGSAPMHSLVLYQHAGESWRQANAGDLAAFSSSPNSAPTTAPAKTAAPSTAPVSAKTVKLAATPATQPADLASDWKPLLAQHGVAPADGDVIASTLTRFGFDSKRLTAVYVMDDAELERLLPMEILPEPRKIVRVGLVIIKNVDPAAGSDIDDLIAQLGDPSWKKREEAQAALAALGSAALAKLQAATNNKDVEIAWHAEKLVALAQKPRP